MPSSWSNTFITKCTHVISEAFPSDSDIKVSNVYACSLVVNGCLHHQNEQRKPTYMEAQCLNRSVLIFRSESVCIFYNEVIGSGMDGEGFRTKHPWALSCPALSVISVLYVRAKVMETVPCVIDLTHNATVLSAKCCVNTAEDQALRVFTYLF